MTVDPAWFAERKDLAADAYVFATYVFETDDEPRSAAAHLAQEQSTAQWKRPGVNEDFRPKHGAKVVSLRVLETNERGKYSAGNGPFHLVEALMAHPHVNFGAKLPNLLTVLLGEGTFYSPRIHAIRLTGLELPDSYAAGFPGPRFGIGGLRDFLLVRDRPFFFGVVKPNVGLPPADFAALAEQAWGGGLDAAKDDEMLADTSWSPLPERAAACGAARQRAENKTGERKLYVANVTDEIDRTLGYSQLAVRLGANALMLNALPAGLSTARALREVVDVPLLAHFDMVAALSRAPGHGCDAAILTTLQRLAGFDIILFPGLGDRMKTTPDEVRAHIRACTGPLGPIAPALPVPGGSSRPADLPGLLSLVGSPDFGMVPGRAVFSHPMGPAAGARAFRQAWEEVKQGRSLMEKARESEELRRSLEEFGS